MDTSHPLEQLVSRPSGRSFFAENHDQQLREARMEYQTSVDELAAQSAEAFLSEDRVLIRETELLVAIKQGIFERRISEVKNVARIVRDLGTET